MQSLQIVVTSHLERASFDEAEPLLRRFNHLVQVCGEPSRQWHRLLLDSMSKFLDGNFDDAADLALRARQYASLFGIADGEDAFCGQSANAHWVFDGFAAPNKDEPGSVTPPYGPVCTALLASTTGGEMAHLVVNYVGFPQTPN